MSTPAAGNGPFEFTDNHGRQVSIPLTAFTFTTGQVQPTVDPSWAAVVTASPAAELLAYALKNKLIKPATPPAAAAAIMVKAADTGAAGNNITVQISALAPDPDPSKTTFTITVTESQQYSALTAATIASVLGTCDASANPVTAGSSPGLVRVLANSVDTTASPSATTGMLSGDPATLEVDGPGSPAAAFTLVAKSGAGGSHIQITVTPIVTSPQPLGPQAFDLAVNWQQSVPGMTLGTIAALVASALGYEITVGTPASGAFSVPAASTVRLSGGGPGVRASGIISTGS
jgi:hypothetical protein